VDAPASRDHNVVGYTNNCFNCCIPVVFGFDSVTNDPCFKNPASGDFRLQRNSPCRDAGLYQAWMAAETDFFGNPRSHNTRHCDIGFHQLPTGGTLILIR